jgi:outer membrane lipase/esterase
MLLSRFFKKLGLLILLSIATSISFAQSYSNLIIFGDSNSDSGRYKYIPADVGGALATYGGFTTNPGLMWTEALGQRFGVTVTPTAAPGGGNNYAAGGARVSYTAAGSNRWSATTQVDTYLSSVSSLADRNALYVMSIGINDLKTTTTGGPGNIVNPQNAAEIITLAQQTAALVGNLHSAGARNFLVPNMNALQSTEVASALGYTYSATTTSSRNLYSQTVWNGIAARGINFIPADWSSVYNFIALNPAVFGITVTNVNTPACGPTTGAINCGPVNYVTANADQTYLFADGPLSPGGGGHYSAVGQKIQSDYYYGLIVAPAQVSLIANQASLSQIAINNSYLDQVSYSFREKFPQTLGAWVLGSAQQVNMINNQASSTSSPYSGAAGIDYQFSKNLLLGGFVGYGQSQVSYNGGGNFTQSGSTLGAYAGYEYQSFWANGLLAYNWLINNVNRVTPIGIATFSNTSSVNGANSSVAAQGGYKITSGRINHGPILGYAYVNTSINGFTESGNFNSLQFGQQNIDSQIGSLGYQLVMKTPKWSPFIRAIYNSQLGNLNRLVTTTLTSVTAPSYTMPAMGYGRDWTNLTAGIGYNIDPKTVIRASFTQQVAQQSVNAYTASISLAAHY